MGIAETQRRGNARSTNCLSHVDKTPNSKGPSDRDVVFLRCCTYIPHELKTTFAMNLRRRELDYM